MTEPGRAFNDVYRGAHLRHLAFPMGGLGAGMICLEGHGAFSHLSLRHRPAVYSEAMMFAAVCVRGAGDAPNLARVIEGPVPDWRIFGPGGKGPAETGRGATHYGLPRFQTAEFHARFPFGQVRLTDLRVPVQVNVTGWSPFIPGDADSVSLPVAGLEYELTNRTDRPMELVWSFHAENFMRIAAAGEVAPPAVRRIDRGFVLWQPGTDEHPHWRGAFAACVDHPDAAVDCAWFRGGWFDARTMLWHAIERGQPIDQPPVDTGAPSPGGSLYVPLRLEPGASTTVRLRWCWHVPDSDVVHPDTPGCNSAGGSGGGSDAAPCYRPWYAGRFEDIEAVEAHWHQRYDELRRRTQAFTDCFYASTLPAEVIEAVAANLTILKSPTVLRQDDGRVWAWEGCNDDTGCCPGTCTHVWNYAQALPHLFPELERTLRQTEYHEDQDDQGHQAFRAFLPIRPTTHDFHAAADGQLGGIVKVYREWRISGDTEWMQQLWPRVRRSLEYCIDTWDPEELGVLVEPHHNTYDIEFWGPDGMCSSFYLAALHAAIAMGKACGDDVSRFETLRDRGRRYVEDKLFNGEYFIQEVRWQGLRAGDPVEAARTAMATTYSPEALRLLEEEGPKYQYGKGCLADGVLGTWLAAVCGLTEPVLDPDKVESHLLAVYRHNLRRDLWEHVNPQRPSYALGHEGGLLLCTWPRGGRLHLPFPYSNEVWTGFEYQVASHLVMLGHVEEGLEIVRLARQRYDGRVRNPFNEYECGHWYARAMSSYALLQAFTGVRYDAVDRTLHVDPKLEGDWRCFLATATGFGTVICEAGKVRVDVAEGDIPVDHIAFAPNNA